MRKLLLWPIIGISTKLLAIAIENARISIFRYGWPRQEICMAIDHDRKNNAKNYSRWSDRKRTNCVPWERSPSTQRNTAVPMRPSRSVKQHLLNYGLCFDKAGNVEHSIMSLLALSRLLGRLDRWQRTYSHVEMVNLCESGTSLKHLIYL